MKRICTICARAGSKGVPGKNIRPLLGKPLIAHSIEQAKQCRQFDAIAVSSDSEEILQIAKSSGADFLIERPLRLATDKAGKGPVIQHCVLAVEKITGGTYDTIVDLDVTSPLRLNTDILNAIDMLESSGVANVITGSPARRSPYFNLVEKAENGTVGLSKKPPNPILCRQDSPECYDMNASIYVWQRDTFMNNPGVFYDDTQIYVMPDNRSIDIDSELDFTFVEFVLTQRKLHAETNDQNG